MYGTIFRNSPQNLHYKMLILGEEILGLSDTVEKELDITHLFPLWINERADSNSPSNHMVKYIQSYYDWLYDKGGYKLSKTSLQPVGMRALLDLDETPVEYLKHFTFAYASGFPEWYIGATAGPNGSDTGPRIRTFIKNIRQGLYQRKSTEEAYQYFFQSLFDTDTEVEIFYPKTKMLRLNNGRFADMQYSETSVKFGTRIGSSSLNSNMSILQDSRWYQEYSYLLSTGVDVVDPDTGLPIYFELLQTLLHPAGLLGFWEKTEADYIPPDDFDGGFQDCESPRLGNYFPYRMKSTEGITTCIGCSGFAGHYHQGTTHGFAYSGPTAMFAGVTQGYAVGMTGWTYGDAWAGVGSGSISIGDENSNDMTTYAYPHWADGICGDAQHSVPFERIYIGDFIYLCPLDRSPNLGITGCTAYEDINAGPCWR